MAIRIPPTSGTTTSPMPVCTISSIPATGSAPSSILSSSTATRSTVIRDSCGAIATMASRTRSATANSNCRTNRAARSIPQRIVTEGHRRLGRSVQDPAAHGAQTAERVEELPVPPG